MKRKVIHLPTSVGGNPQGISKYLNEIGMESETWILQQNYFNYTADRVLSSTNSPLILQEVQKIFSLIYILRCDIVFFNYGRGLFVPYVALNFHKHRGIKKILLLIYAFYSKIMAHLEVSALSLLKKPIFIQYQGDDARQGDYCKKNFEVTTANNVDEHYYSMSGDIARRNNIKFYSRKAAKIYSLNPDLMHVLPSRTEFLPYSHISLEDWAPIYNQLEERPLRIGHAPSHRGFKGTNTILTALENLVKKNYQFELILIEGKSNVEAKEIYKSVDIFIDQILAGWYGGLALEVMALGKPVIAYIREADLRFIPDDMAIDLPIIHANPKNIETVVEEILNTPRERLLLKAKESRRFVEKWHNPAVIAERIKNDMKIAMDLE